MERIEIKLPEYSYAMNEEVKSFRTNIQFAGKDKQVILVTSCIQGEGKSGTSFKLAKSFTELKKKVLLVDADLRASVMNGNIVGTRPKVGLSHFLSGQAPFSEVMYATNIRGLYTCVSGPVPPNPTELLSSKLFSDMIDSMRKNFDYIIIDSAPLGLVVDAAILARVCDAAVLVVESGAIKRKVAQNVKQRLEETGCPLLGVVLTKVEHSGNKKYYDKYYGNYYGKHEADVDSLKKKRK